MVMCTGFLAKSIIADSTWVFHFLFMSYLKKRFYKNYDVTNLPNDKVNLKSVSLPLIVLAQMHSEHRKPLHKMITPALTYHKEFGILVVPVGPRQVLNRYWFSLGPVLVLTQIIPKPAPLRLRAGSEYS